jgi:hypothetical protein
MLAPSPALQRSATSSISEARTDRGHSSAIALAAGERNDAKPKIDVAAVDRRTQSDPPWFDRGQCALQEPHKIADLGSRWKTRLIDLDRGGLSNPTR